VQLLVDSLATCFTHRNQYTFMISMTLHLFKMQDKNQSWINLFKELLSARSLFLKVLFLLVTIFLASLLSSSPSVFFHSAMALKQHHNKEKGAAFISSSSSSPSSQINSNSMSNAIPTPSNNTLLYYNSTYGIVFQSPYGWNKFELLSGRITTVGFTSPTGHVSIVISIEKGLGKVSTLGQYDQVAQKLLHTTLGNFISAPSRPATLLGQPAIERVLFVKQPSGIHINIAQIFTLKNSKAYVITYTAPADMYSSYFPILQQLVNSFQITK
jgi:hypothetical protein